jgi:hypothetical protein
MVKVELIKNAAYIVRFYEDDAFANSDRPPFVASCIFEYDEDPEVVWLKNMSGTFKRKQLRDITILIRDFGFKKAKALRVEGHILPFGKLNDKGEYEMVVEEALKRLKV